MGESGLILGVSGLRGIVGESLTVEVAARYGHAIGWWLRSKCGPVGTIVIAEDGRRGGQTIKLAVASGLVSSGFPVEYIGIATTPTVGVAVDQLNAVAGVQITASHNPQEWNGIKLLLNLRADLDDRLSEGASAPPAQIAQEIIEFFQTRSWREMPSSDHCSYLMGEDHAHTHMNAVHDAMCNCDMDCFDHPDEDRMISIDDNAYRICVDSVNASGKCVVDELAARFECELIQIAGLDTGVFPHTPEPTRENLSGEGGLCDVVPGVKADVGFAQDPDADRLAIVDELGNYIGEEYTLVLAAVSLLEARKEGSGEDEAPHPGPLPRGEREEEDEARRPGPLPRGEREEAKAVIVTNLSTSRMIDDVAARYGARVERTAVGEANVVERMKALKANGEDVILGGEGNGGVIWPEVVYVRDSLSAMALTLALMARTGKTVSELVAQIDSMAEGGERREGGGTGGTPVPRGGRGGGRGYTIIKRKVEIPSKDAAAPAVEAVRRACEGEAGAVVDLQDGVRVDWPAQRAWVHVRASNTEPIMRLICEAGSEGEAEALLARVEGMIASG